jgi:ornithine cyclodeaminase/alanine dehydrogenase-like protein (mu-crystallin family)
LVRTVVGRGEQTDPAADLDCGTCDDWEQSEPGGTPARVRIYADDWEQASHNGDIAYAVAAGLLERDDVAQLGDVLIGTAEGRQSDRDITIFDSTGLAIQDLAIALAAMERADGTNVRIIEL